MSTQPADAVDPGPDGEAPSLDAAMRFPPAFDWGVATSSFQIEGAAAEDGKGESIWDRFCRVPGAIEDGSDGNTACDHVHRWSQDLDLIAALEVDTYRFSVSWPRVMPEGRGRWNPKGLDFYERLVDGQLARGVRSHLTLNHWDLPQALQDHGGWASRETMHHFVDYARGIGQRLSDRVAQITTHNEPWVIAHLGHETGTFAPGVRNRATAWQVTHHLLLSHGLALQALRADGCGAELGIVLNMAPIQSATASPVDVALARIEDGKLVRGYMDPLFGRGYPPDLLEHLGADAPRVRAGETDLIAAPLDFLGVNYYARNVVGAGPPFDAAAKGLPVTAMGWEVYPRGLTELLLRLHRDYPLPKLIVTENGAAFVDRVEGERVRDRERTEYIARHIDALADALGQGVPLAGYFVWSLMDNFEWTRGYAKRFGLLHVDYATQRRTWKDSAYWYRRFVRRCRGATASHPVAAASAGTA